MCALRRVLACAAQVCCQLRRGREVRAHGRTTSALGASSRRPTMSPRRHADLHPRTRLLCTPARPEVVITSTEKRTHSTAQRRCSALVVPPEPQCARSRKAGFSSREEDAGAAAVRGGAVPAATVCSCRSRGGGTEAWCRVCGSIDARPAEQRPGQGMAGPSAQARRRQPAVQHRVLRRDLRRGAKDGEGAPPGRAWQLERAGKGGARNGRSSRRSC